MAPGHAPAKSTLPNAVATTTATPKAVTISSRLPYTGAPTQLTTPGGVQTSNATLYTQPSIKKPIRLVSNGAASISSHTLTLAYYDTYN